MKPSELLREVRRRVLVPGAWTPFSSLDPTCGCVLNHLWRVAWESVCHVELADDRFHRSNEIAREAVGAMGGDGLVVSTNDDGPTSLWGVVALVGKGIRRLEAGGR